MLIAFRFKNFRSFSDVAELSMVAHRSDKMHQRSLLTPDKQERSNMRLLPAAAIYGANAAGKTNILQALEYLKSSVMNSHTNWKPGSGTDLTQHRSNGSGTNSVFEADIVIEGLRYNYGFAANPEHIEEEWLSAYPLGRERRLFTRNTKKMLDGKFVTSVDCKEHLSGDKRYLAAMIARTRENSLFVSAAAQDNQAECSAVHNWFRTKLSFVELADQFDPIDVMYTADTLVKIPSLKPTLLKLIKAADSAITDIEVTESDISKNLQSIDESMRKFIEYRSRYSIAFIMKDGDGNKVRIPFNEESRGVRKLFSFASTLVFALEVGQVFVLDEIESSIHPHLARFIIELFQNPETNKRGAQIIFTTHDTNILDKALLRRDQIWFVEKSFCASSLYPLLKFSPRKDENLETGYLRGRYGAIPALSLRDNWLLDDDKSA